MLAPVVLWLAVSLSYLNHALQQMPSWHQQLAVYVDRLVNAKYTTQCQYVA